MLEGSNTIFEVEYFDLPGGDITSIPCNSREDARKLAVNTIKNKGQCMNWMSGHNRSWHKEISRVSKFQSHSAGQAYMYFAAEEVANAPVPNGYSLCYVPNIDPQHGDIRPWKSSHSLEEAKVKAGQTLKDPKNCVLWFPRIKNIVHKRITTTVCFKGYGGTFFLGRKICKREEKQDEKIVIKSIKEKQDGEADYNFCSRY